MGITHSEVDDLVQEVFVIVQRRLKDYDGRASLRSWVYQIARGVVSNHRRGQQRESRRLRLAGAVDPEAPAGPDDAVELAQATLLVQEFLVTLSADQRTVFELCDIEGIPGPDVARSLGVPKNTVYSRLRLARARFALFVAQHQRVAGQRTSGGLST